MRRDRQTFPIYITFKQFWQSLTFNWLALLLRIRQILGLISIRDRLSRDFSLFYSDVPSKLSNSKRTVEWITITSFHILHNSSFRSPSQRCITNTAEGREIRRREWTGRCPGSICSLTAQYVYIPATHSQAPSVLFRRLHDLNTSAKTSGDLLLHRFIYVPERREPITK